MRFIDFLRTTVLLTAGEATALAAVAILAAAGDEDTTTIIFSLAWWAVAAIIGAWIGRGSKPSTRIATLLAEAGSSQALPELTPARVLLNRLWPLGVIALIAAGSAWVYPQFSSVAAGYAILVALSWRKHEAAVTAIEGRDGAQFYVLPTSPFRGMELVRTPGYHFPTGNGTGPA